MAVCHYVMRSGIWECAYITHFRSLKFVGLFLFVCKVLLFYTFWWVSTDRHCGTQLAL